MHGKNKESFISILTLISEHILATSSFFRLLWLWNAILFNVFFDSNISVTELIIKVY